MLQCRVAIAVVGVRPSGWIAEVNVVGDAIGCILGPGIAGAARLSENTLVMSGRAANLLRGRCLSRAGIHTNTMHCELDMDLSIVIGVFPDNRQQCAHEIEAVQSHPRKILLEERIES